MTYYTDFDQDKTNPRFFHSLFPDTTETDPDRLRLLPEELEQPQTDELDFGTQATVDLYEPETAINITDDALEMAREDPFYESLGKEIDNYPDEFTLSHSQLPKNREDLVRHEEAIEDFYDSEITFDPTGDEGELEETRPLFNTKDENL